MRLPILALFARALRVDARAMSTYAKRFGLLAVIFSTDQGKVAQKPVKARRGVHVLKIRKREPERQKTLEEVRDEVFRTLRARESRKVRSGLLNELHQRYNAVIHHAKFEPRTPEAKPGSAAPPKTPGTKAHAPKPK